MRAWSTWARRSGESFSKMEDLEYGRSEGMIESGGVIVGLLVIAFLSCSWLLRAVLARGRAPRDSADGGGGQLQSVTRAYVIVTSATGAAPERPARLIALSDV